ncbi:MAG: PLD nuclease N-terminal domain-containing protein [Defluviitaleaceae bacterium]|nr:PLD nuclease N-terminal domain-containing protein [Defluviitaleaceae bacterium]
MNVNFGTTDWDAAVDLITRMLPILIPMLIVQWALMITAIISIAKKPNPWNEKILWLLLAILVSIIGPVIYFALGSGMLDGKWAQEQDLRDQQRGGGYPPHQGGGMS